MPASLQIRRYLSLRAEMSRDEAAAEAGIGLEEARLTDIANDRGEIEFAPLNHNQPKEPVMAEGNIAADELRLLIERVERLEEEKKALSDDIRDVYAEGKARGYDVKTMREMVKLRKMEPHARAERDALVETYRAALGMDFAETPLGSATMRTVMEKAVEAVNAGALGPGVTATFHPGH